MLALIIYFWLVETDWLAAVMFFVVWQLLLVMTSPRCLHSFVVVNVVNELSVPVTACISFDEESVLKCR